MKRAEWLTLTIDALAIARLSRLLTVDEVPVVKRPRDAILRRYPPHGTMLVGGKEPDEPGPDGWVIHESDDAVETGWTVRPDGRRITGLLGSFSGRRVLYVDDASGSDFGYLIQCPYCTSAYLSVGVLAARRWAPRVWDVAATWLAFQMVAGLVNAKG